MDHNHVHKKQLHSKNDSWAYSCIHFIILKKTIDFKRNYYGMLYVYVPTPNYCSNYVPHKKLVQKLNAVVELTLSQLHFLEGISFKHNT